MSVPVNLRKVKETETTNKGDAVDKCAQLYNHALLCCRGDKIQASVYAPLAGDILEMSKQIYLDAFEANAVPFYKGRITEEQYETRKRLILQAMRGCSRLDGLLLIGKKNFHWRERKRQFWSDITRDAKEQLSKWLSWCTNEFRLSSGQGL